MWSGEGCFRDEFDNELSSGKHSARNNPLCIRVSLLRGTQPVEVHRIGGQVPSASTVEGETSGNTVREYVQVSEFVPGPCIQGGGAEQCVRNLHRRHQLEC